MSNPGSKPFVARDRKGHEVQYQTRGEPLGAGAGSTVYLATRLPGLEQAAADDARLVAVKIASTPKWKGHLADEARLLDDLQKRADAVVHRSGGTVYRPIRISSGPTPLTVDDPQNSGLIELEYLDGLTLQQWFDTVWCLGSASEPNAVVDEVLLIARQLAEALVQIQCGRPDGAIIHRDIKPENIMRTSRGLRLFDFNVAREDLRSTKTQHVGTPGYMAPEVHDGEQYDARADLFSVGLILWEVAHRRRFDQPMNTHKEQGKLRLNWPTAMMASWPERESKVLDELLPVLICSDSARIVSADELLKLVERLEEPRRAARAASDPLAKLDMIQLLSELSPSGLAAVVTDTKGKVHEQTLQDFLRERMQVDDPLEDWLLHELVEAATRNTTRPTLFVLAGNAGDGKSHLLFRLLRKRLAKRPDVLARIRAIADATHALTPDGSQTDRLADFFAPFADENPAKDPRVHLIAMNTGMVINFFEGKVSGAPYKGLYRELQRQLGLRRVDATLSGPPWHVEVVNLDLRDLLAPGANGAPSFAERMLDRLDPERIEGIVGPKWAACQSCSAFALCPVAFNLKSLRQSHPRQALLRILRRVALDTDIHLSPRNLWGFLYRLTTGGIERYVGHRRKEEDGLCDAVRAQVNASAGEWLLAGQFTELLFQQPHAGTPWSGLERHDPAFSNSPMIDHLHTRLSIKTELDNAPEIVEQQLGGVGQALAGLKLDALTSILPRTSAFKGRRRDAAVRRQVLFHRETFDAWAASDGGGDFEGVLAAYNEYSRHFPAIAKLGPATREHLKQLRKLVQDVFLHGNGRRVDGVPYLRVSQPNVRSRSELLVRADYAALEEQFNVLKIVAPDVHIRAHDGRARLLDLLGYRPTQVTLDILGIRLTIDLELYEFLRRVNDGQKPSVRALSQFQALLLIGERVGNALASGQRTKELYVWDGAKAHLHRLALDDFGHPHLNTVY